MLNILYIILFCRSLENSNLCKEWIHCLIDANLDDEEEDAEEAEHLELLVVFRIHNTLH